MKNFNEGRGGFGGSKGGGFKKAGGSSFGNKPRFGADKKFGGGGRDRGDKGPELFSATCAQCGKECKVPFRPSNDKPVFCSDCFGRKSSDENRGGGGREERGQFLPRNEGRGDRRDERPARRDADQGSRNAGGNNDELKRTVANLEQKLNRVLDLLASMAPQKSTKPSTPDSVVMVVKAEKKAPEATVATPVAPAKKAAKKVAAPAEKVAKKVAKKAPAKVAKAPAKKVAKAVAKVAKKK